MANKLTVNDIIKAWEKILSTGDAPIGEHWSVGAIVTTKLAKDTFDMLNRQKAEIERLRSDVNRLKKYDEERDIRLHARLTETARAEAIKEFADRLKKKMIITHRSKEGVCVYEFDDELIDDLVKEMVGE